VTLEQVISCGPFICDYPDPSHFRWLARWTCPNCRTVYVRARAVKRQRWWRNWTAEAGHWVLPMIGRRHQW